MEYSLTFKPDSVAGKFMVKHRDIGVAGVDKIFLEVGSASLFLIGSKIITWDVPVRENITLERARETGRFTHTNEIVVRVGGGVEKFIVEKVVAEKHDKIINVFLTYEVDFNKLYQAWEAKGYPTTF